jgi:hypothetical protein
MISKYAVPTVSPNANPKSVKNPVPHRRSSQPPSNPGATITATTARIRDTHSMAMAIGGRPLGALTVHSRVGPDIGRWPPRDREARPVPDAPVLANRRKQCQPGYSDGARLHDLWCDQHRCGAGVSVARKTDRSQSHSIPLMRPTPARRGYADVCQGVLARRENTDHLGDFEPGGCVRRGVRLRLVLVMRPAWAVMARRVMPPARRPAKSGFPEHTGQRKGPAWLAVSGNCRPAQQPQTQPELIPT